MSVVVEVYQASIARRHLRRPSDALPLCATLRRRFTDSAWLPTPQHPTAVGRRHPQPFDEAYPKCYLCERRAEDLGIEWPDKRKVDPAGSGAQAEPGS